MTEGLEGVHMVFLVIELFDASGRTDTHTLAIKQSP